MQEICSSNAPVVTGIGDPNNSQVVKTKYTLLWLKVPWPMSAISETYNRGHDILELVDILPNVSFTASEMERDYY